MYKFRTLINAKVSTNFKTNTGKQKTTQLRETLVYVFLFPVFENVFSQTVFALFFMWRLISSEIWHPRMSQMTKCGEVRMWLLAEIF